jgi:hypothetical protein
MRRRNLKGLSVERPAAYLYARGILHFLGRWDTKDLVAIARERALLHFGIKNRGRARQQARRVSTASPEELRQLARAQYRATMAATSRFHGVSFNRHRQSFCAQICHKKKRMTIGFFDDENEAAMAVDRLSTYLGLPARNFPRRKIDPASIGALRRELGDKPHAPRGARRKTETSSQFRGVHYSGENSERPWVVYFRSTATKMHAYVASFESERDAALAYDRIVLCYRTRPVLNFPSQAQILGPATVEMIRAQATRERKERTTSRYRGVYRTRSGRWASQIMHRGKVHRLGLYEVEIAAAHAYDDAAYRLGEEARVNFPPVDRVAAIAELGQRRSVQQANNAGVRTAPHSPRDEAPRRRRA